jgi:Lrp/AsnC family transcriptional regulator
VELTRGIQRRAEMTSSRPSSLGQADDGKATMVKLDATDLKILQVLQADAASPSGEIAARVGMSQSPAWRRIANLERSGAIRKRVAIIDRQVVGLSFMAFVFVRLKDQTQPTVDRFKEDVQSLPEVVQCHVLMGDIDYILVVIARDIEHFRKLLRKRLSNFPGVSGLDSRVVLEEVKNTTELPLDSLAEDLPA